MKLTGDRNQCPTCSRYFNSVRAFDKHRVGSFEAGRRCLHPEEMLERGMVVGSDGFWRGSAMPKDVIFAKSDSQ